MDASTVAPDMRFERKALPPERNAFVEWEEADRLFVELPEEIKQAAALAWSLEGKAVSAGQKQLIEPWLQTNAPALALVEKGLRKDSAQVPQWDPATLGPLLRAPFELAKLRLFQADAAAQRGDHATATNLFLGNLKFARTLQRADVPLIHYLVGRAMRSSTEKAVQRWALFSDASGDQLRAMLAQLPELSDEPDVYEHVLRVEWTDHIAHSVDIQKQAKEWIELFRTNEFALMMYPEELQRPALLTFDPQLLGEHPAPIDTNAYARFFGARFGAYVDAARAPWSRSHYDELLEVTDQIRTEFVEDFAALLKATEDDDLPLESKRARSVVRHFKKVKNPLGRFYQANDNLTRTYIHTFQSRTERNATRAILALRIFEKEKGHLPGTLDELVTAGLLSELPIDLFANAPFHYSAEKGTLWSVGEDEVDDGGVGGTRSWMEKDMVWKLKR